MDLQRIALVDDHPAASDCAPGSDVVTRRVYFQGLGLVCLIAFLSLWTQIHGLIGSDGLLPAGDYFRLAQDKLGTSAYWRLPSVCWFGSGDAMLHAWCALGTGLSLLLMIGLAPRLVLPLLWLIYLSLGVAGQAFLSFQWDTLLLEMLACSFLYAPRGWRPDWTRHSGNRSRASEGDRPIFTGKPQFGRESRLWKSVIFAVKMRQSPAREQLRPSEPLRVARWLLWGLAFKLMFLSGVTKLLSGDPAWNDGTALQFHCYTQPIPTWTSWYAYQMPLALHQLALLLMFIVEVLLPFLIFVGRRGRAVFGLATILLMVAIEVTGNFGFFNLQAIVLCVPLLGDSLLRWLIPRRWMGRERPADNAQATASVGMVRPQWRSVTGTAAAVVILCISGLTSIREMVRTQQPDRLPRVVVTVLGAADRFVLSWGEPWLIDRLSPFRTINGYGLFRVMTTRRPEIVVEISDDGLNWEPCEFPYKPGRVDRAPPIVAPHMPRLDWQMWFAALNPQGNEYWLSALSGRILEGSPAVARLLGRAELARAPPRFVRLAYYEYKFSSAEQRRATGAWWSRSHVGDLTGTLSRRSE